jgi:ribosomal protein S18 acetylase RimI-like enzyme
LKSRTSYNEVAEKSFELDEFYVSKDFRGQSIGKKLYQYLELSIKEKVDLIRTIAILNQYNELLNFYIDQLGLSFNHALLVKRL